MSLQETLSSTQKRLSSTEEENMTLKLFVILSAYVLLANGSDVERKGNKSTCQEPDSANMIPLVICTFIRIEEKGSK
jgi:uncharacterized lipoprotein YajG